MADFTDTLEEDIGPATVPYPEIAIAFPELSSASAAPTVSYVTPPGALDPLDDLVVDVLDVDSPAPSTFLFARFAANGVVDVVWDGTAFAPFYGTSTRDVIANGHRYTLRRSGGGWISGGLTINANAIDDTGSVAT